jgi:hypothetical protein
MSLKERRVKRSLNGGTRTRAEMPLTTRRFFGRSAPVVRINPIEIRVSSPLMTILENFLENL